jgi:hypothetical protein
VAKSAAQRALAEQEAQHEELLQAAWESQRESVAAAVAAELAPARAALAAEAERELAAQSAFARDAARRLAQSLAAQARAEYSAHLEPALRQLEAQRASHAVVAPHLAALRAQCVQALLALRAGREPSVDLRPLVAPFPLLAEAAAAAVDAAAPGGGAARGAPPPAPPVDVCALLEEQDAASLRLTVPAARDELARLVGSVLQRWLELPGSTVDECVQMLRSSQEAAAGAPRPPGAPAPPPAPHAGGRAPPDLAAEYRREAERLLAADRIAAAEAALGDYLQDKRLADATLQALRHTAASAADVQAALGTAREHAALAPQVHDLQAWLADAYDLVRARRLAPKDDAAGADAAGGVGGVATSLAPGVLDDLEPPQVPLPLPAHV